MFQLDWSKKLFLAHGVVRGMEYLHSIKLHPVIHGDLKLQNVLVGEDMVAKVCLNNKHIFCLHLMLLLVNAPNLVCFYLYIVFTQNV